MAVAFTALEPIDASHLPELALIAGATSADYSNEAADGFTITRGDVSFVVSGTFTFTGGLPDADGTVSGVLVMTGPHNDYDFGFPDQITVAHFDALFASGIALVIRN